MMTIDIESYGKITQYLPVDYQLEIDSKMGAVSVAQVLETVVSKYPQAAQALEKCACAIGEDIASRQSMLTEDVQLVLLSPVAEG
ncbi:hypothetical protein [Acinetobacter guillouiae]|uniref:hypothetical protein n=1 Tax=Acinetobacter guillouiae TaxID=106649 RepID=UPI002FD89F75